MTIYLSAILPKSELPVCFELFATLSDDLSQIEISDGENDPKFPVTFKQLVEGKDVPIDLSGGYFLHAQNARYNVGTLNDVSLFIECADEQVAWKLMNLLATCKIIYAYACEYAERVHQNRIAAKKSYGVDEQWVGRDSTKYLPGVYWLNLVPKSLLEQHGIDARSVDSISKTFKRIGDDKYLFQLYPKSTDWTKHTESIDLWRLNTPGVFFKKAAQIALEEASNFLEASEATRDWK